MAESDMQVEIARFDERLKSIERMMTEVVAGQKEAIDGRRRGYEAQDRIEKEVVGITYRMTSVEKSLDSIRPTTLEFERVRNNVMGAGAFGKFLWAAGKALLSAAAGAAAVYYTLTGRPPP